MTRRFVRICLWFFLSVVVPAVPAAAQPADLESVYQFHEGHEAGDPGSPASLELHPLSDTPCQGGVADIYPCQNVDLESFIPLAELGAELPRERAAGLWGWTDPQTRREYALIALRNRVTFVDVTNPKQPQVLGWLPGVAQDQPNREVNVYGNHAFIVADGSGTENGLQIFDLTQLRGRSGPPVSFPATAHIVSAGRVHNFSVNPESGFGYAVGGTQCGGLRMFDLRDPASFRQVGCWSDSGQTYIHDTQCVIYRGPDARFQGREICFASAADSLLIVDVTDKGAPAKLARTSYPGMGYVHQAWLTEDHRFAVMNDEGDELSRFHNTRTYLWNLADLTAPQQFAVYEHATLATDHNLYVHDGKVYEANYRAGLRILDASRIAAGELAEVGFFDIVPASDEPGFEGAWNVYPFFASGSIIVSGISQGLYVLRERQERLPATCKPGPDTLCALGNRLQIEVDGTSAGTGARTRGRVVRRGANLGLFSFDGTGVDLMVKVAASGQKVNVLYGQLTSLPFTIRIVDTKKKTVARLTNSANNCGGVQQLKGLAEVETAGDLFGLLNPHALDFAAAGPGISEKISLSPGREGGLGFVGAPHEAGTCKTSPNRLCLLNRRFAVELTWRDRGASGAGKATRVTDAAGSFGFRNPATAEVAVKAVEVGDTIRIVWGSLTNAAYSINVTDTRSGETKTYTNPAGTFCGGVDPVGFAH
jgi:choice-of-anchor B domain-containing protein